LEEEALTATAKSDVLTITRRTIAETPPGPLTIIAPDGTSVDLTLPQVEPGKYQIDWQAPMLGLYRLEQGNLTRVVGVGPSAPREFVETIANPTVLAPVVAPMQGGIVPIESGLPSLRDVREGRPAAGRGWLGITPRGAYVTQDLRVVQLLPAWLILVLASLLAISAWLVEGRRSRKA